MSTRGGVLHTSALLRNGPRTAVLFRFAEGRRPELDAPDDARTQGVTLDAIRPDLPRSPGQAHGAGRD
jgi:hypothetical protein